MAQEETKDNDHPRTSGNTADDQFPADLKSYKLLAQIGGDGAPAAVFKAFCLPLNSAVVAIKMISLDSSHPDLEYHGWKMANSAAALRHPNLLKPHRVFTAGLVLCVVMPFVSGGSLQSILNSSFPDGLKETLIAAVLKPALAALACLHDGYYSHRAISAANILIDSDGSVKLADWGFSAADTSPPSTAVSDLPYWVAPQPPEKVYGADIWALGVTALELMLGKAPVPHYATQLSKPLLKKIVKRFQIPKNDGGGETDITIGSNEMMEQLSSSDCFRKMVALCLDKDLTKRPTPKQLLTHPFFENIDGGPDFLVKNLLHGLPSLEERFKKPMRFEEDEIVTGRRRIVGWEFEGEGGMWYELKPVLGGQTPSAEAEKGKVDSDDCGYGAVMKCVERMMKSTDDQIKIVRRMIGVVVRLEIADRKAIAELRAEVEQEKEKRRAVEMELASLESEIVSEKK